MTESKGRMYWDGALEGLPLAHSIGENRHLRAVCACGASSVVDTSMWIAEGLGGQPIPSFYDRMRCACGARSVKLEIWYRQVRPSLQGMIYVFR